MIETLYEDKKRLEKELSQCKEKLSSASQKLSTLSDAQKLENTLKDHSKAISEKGEQISGLEGEISMRDEQIQKMQRELSLAYRAIHIQNKFEQHSNLPNSLGLEKESLRSLYFTLAKCQQEKEDITKALAQQHEELRAAQQLAADKTTLSNKLDKDSQDLSLQLQYSRDHLSSLQEEVEDLRAQQQLHSSTIDNLKMEYLTLSQTHEESCITMQTKIMQLEQVVVNQREEIERYGVQEQKARERGEILERALDQLNFNFQEKMAMCRDEKARLQVYISTLEEEGRRREQEG
ncbi:hypothetical protein EON65_49930, partial [archaeon]